MSRVLITGASGDIGAATARKFAKEGHSLALFGFKNYDSLIPLSKQLSTEFGADSFCYRCNAADDSEVKATFKKAEKQLGGIDVLINCAGISFIGLDQNMTGEEWAELCSTNLSSVMYFCRSAIPEMVNRKAGKIINISSMWGTYGASCEAAYSATKGGINAYTKALAKELAPSGISVNALALGAIDTKMNSHLSSDEKKAFCEQIPFGRMATVTEAADMIYCLFSAPSYLTGQVIGFDGGY